MPEQNRRTLMTESCHTETVVIDSGVDDGGHTPVDNCLKAICRQVIYDVLSIQPHAEQRVVSFPASAFEMSLSTDT